MADSKSNQQNTQKKGGSKSASLNANCSASKKDISRIINSSYRYFRREPPKSDEEIAERLDEYFRYCSENEELPLVENMALAVGVSRETLWKWETGGEGSTPSRRNMMKRAKGILAAIDAHLVSEGKIPQITYIFRAKNFFGMKDQQDVVVTPNNPLGDSADADGLKQKYLEDNYGGVIEQKDDTPLVIKKDVPIADRVEQHKEIIDGIEFTET